MKKRTSKKSRPPVEYPSVPDGESGQTRYNEPSLPAPADRVPTHRFHPQDTRADLRLRVERLLQHKEAAPEDAWAELGPDARSLLVELLDDEVVRSQESILHRMIGVVGQLSIKRAVAPLSALLTDGSASPVTRAAAANALGRIGEPAAIEALAACARLKDDMIRRQVAIALGRIDRETVVPYLLSLREDESTAVAETAAEALRGWEERWGQRLATGHGRASVRGTTRTRKKKSSPGRER